MYPRSPNRAVNKFVSFINTDVMHDFNRISATPSDHSARTRQRASAGQDAPATGRQLEDMFRRLDLIHDEISVAADAARSNELPELDNMLRLSVAAKLFGQLEQLTKIIERLGGKTVLSEAVGSPQVVRQQQ